MKATGCSPSADFYQETRRSLEYALSRFGTRVERVCVRWSNSENPLGGVETLCRITAQLRARGAVCVQILDGKTAIHRAIARLGEHIERVLLDGSSDEIPSRVATASDLFDVASVTRRPVTNSRSRLVAKNKRKG
ncbi:MAG: hypothetical protein MUF51_00910 [Vicinamibacteria bacterium]|jgi:hypothetical protein|nr:hypothetical protein [Vicinamibacteria bacterium]